MNATVETPRRDGIKWTIHASVAQYSPEQVEEARRAFGVDEPTAEQLAEVFERPAATVDMPGNLLTTAGLTRLTSLLTGGGGQALTNTSGRIGVGNSATAEAVGQTDLQASAGSTNRWFQVLDASYPSVAAGVVTCRATFASADGNFSWAEWCIDIGTPTVTSANTVNATLLNRKVASLGSKVSGAVWVFTVTLTFS